MKITLPSASNCAFVQILLNLPLILPGLCEDFLQRDKLQAVPDVGYQHGNKKQELMAVARNITFTCFHQIVLSAKATIPLHLLNSTD